MRKWPLDECMVLLGLLCFASFRLGIFKHKRQVARYLNVSLPLLLVPSTPTYPLSNDQGLSSVASAHCTLAMFFEHYKFVTFVTGAVCRD